MKSREGRISVKFRTKRDWKLYLFPPALLFLTLRYIYRTQEYTEFVIPLIVLYIVILIASIFVGTATYEVEGHMLIVKNLFTKKELDIWNILCIKVETKFYTQYCADIDQFGITLTGQKPVWVSPKNPDDFLEILQEVKYQRGRRQSSVGGKE